MPVAYEDIRAMVDDTKFQRRLQVAVWRAASLVLREDPATPGNALRKAWAKEQLKGPPPNMTEVLIRLGTSGKVYQNGTAVTDDDLQTAMNGIVNDLAGV